MLCSDTSTLGSSASTTSGSVDVIHVDSDFQAFDNQMTVCDTSGTTVQTGGYGFTVTLPSDPVDKEFVRIMDGSANAQNRPIRISADKLIINKNNIICDINYFDVKVIFDSSKDTWSIAGL